MKVEDDEPSLGSLDFTHTGSDANHWNLVLGYLTLSRHMKIEDGEQ
jgi:hypothetical protein